MTSGGQGAAPRSARRVAGRPAYPGRLTVRPPPSLSRRERFTRSLGKAFYWQGWKTVAAVAASLVAIATAVVAIQTFRVSQQGLGVSEQTLHANTRQQTSDRFVKAIEQLGNDKSLDVRLGGIYGLELLARDSPSDHPAVFDVLTAFVRGHAPATLDNTCADAPPKPPTADIQTTIDVIARRDRRYDRSDRPMDLSLTCLVGVVLRRGQLAGIRMFAANLRVAVLAGADLQGTMLEYSDLSNSYAVGADLKSADLSGADLSGANLTGANLTGANLTDIYYDASTQWPKGFQPPPSRPHS
jgi:hypothetical protein